VVLLAISAALAVSLLALAAFTWQVMAGRDAARLEVARLTTASRHEIDALHQRTDGLAASMRSQHETTRSRLQMAVETLQWSLNQSALVPFDEPPFNDDAAQRLGELLARLAALDFRGRVVLTAELAPFCLARNRFGVLELADPAMPTDACELSGHPAQDASAISTLQSVGFANALADAQAYPEITVELSARAPFAPETSLPSNVDTAGDWNRQASHMNRVEVALIPRPTRPADKLAGRR
jgi:hypothetical protein